MTVQIHPTALVHKNARIGKGVTIGPYTVIEGHTSIGDRSVIGPHVYIAEGARIGSECTIFKGASIATVPQDLKFQGEKTTLEIGDSTVVREFCTLNRGTSATGRTCIGTHCLLMAYCHVAHDCSIGDYVIISNNLAMAGHVEVGNHVTIGGVVPIHQFTRIGDYAFIGATTYLTQDVLPFALCAGTPARLRGINAVGLERRGFSAARRQKLKRIFKTLFHGKGPLTKAVDALAARAGEDRDIIKIVEFIRVSGRGVVSR